MTAHGGLQQSHSTQALQRFLRGQQHEHGGAGANHNGVKNHAKGLQQPRLGRMADLGGSGGAGSGAGTCLIGKQSPLDTVHQRPTEGPRRGLTQAEGLLHDVSEDPGQQSGVFHNDKNRQQKIEPRHDGHNHVQHLHTGVFPQHHHRRQCHQHHRRHDGRDGEGILEGGGDGVADDLAHAAPAQKARQSKGHGQDAFLLPPAEKGVDVIGRAAPVAAEQGVTLLIKLSQGGFHEGSGGANQGCHPHPEHRAGAASGNRRHNAHHVAHADSGGRGHDEGLDA